MDGEEDIEEDLEDAEEEAAVAVTIIRKRKRRSPSTSPDHQPARRRPMLSKEHTVHKDILSFVLVLLSLSCPFVPGKSL